LARLLDTKWSNTVRHHNSVFPDLLKRVPWGEFDRLTKEHGADLRVRRLPTKSQFIAVMVARAQRGHVSD